MTKKKEIRLCGCFMLLTPQLSTANLVPRTPGINNIGVMSPAIFLKNRRGRVGDGVGAAMPLPDKIYNNFFIRLSGHDF
ncbi:MAG: hypothetical protein OEW18_00320 [Candidatus Aminicenantes bacterium]|nr:hypothetical protein [Candidatus Aminicenantes bacterium]